MYGVLFIIGISAAIGFFIKRRKTLMERYNSEEGGKKPSMFVLTLQSILAGYLITVVVYALLFFPFVQ